LKVKIALFKSGIKTESKLLENSEDFFQNIQDQIQFKHQPLGKESKKTLKKKGR